MASKDIRKNPCKQEESEEREGKAVPGTVEVTVRIMGETGLRTQSADNPIIP